MSIRIANAAIVFKNKLLKNSSLLIDGGKIKSFGTAARRKEKSAFVIDAKGMFVSPGFIDTHIHGDPEKVLSHETRFGTTQIVLAISCDSRKNIVEKIARIRAFRKRNPLGASVLGARLEGPFISKEKAGAQDKRFIEEPSKLKCIHSPLLKIITIAPELKGAINLIKLLKKRGIIISLGHSNATYYKAKKGMSAGASHVTHIFNAMSGAKRGQATFSKRKSSLSPFRGLVGAALYNKKIYTEIILDLIHTTKEEFTILLKLKEENAIIIVTDSIRSEPKTAKLKDGVYRFKNGTIAGSRLTMIDALKNAVLRCGISLPLAVKFMTLNPARLLGIERKTGSIEAGKDADLIMFDKNFNVKMTMIRGEIAYSE